MTRTALLALATLFFLDACATSQGTKYSVTPQTQVTVKSHKKRSAAQVNYQVSPEASRLTGSGGSAQ